MTSMYPLSPSLLANAQKAMADNDDGLAPQFAGQAHTDAQLAMKKVQSAKARNAAADAQAAARALHEDMDAIAAWVPR